MGFGHWLANDCPLVSDVCELACETGELVKEAVDDPALVGQAFCYAIDGHDDKVEKKIVANPGACEDLENQLREANSIGMKNVISDIHVAMIKLNGYTGEVGTLNFDCFDEVLNEFGSASTEIATQISSAVAAINEYQGKGIGVKILGNCLMGVTKFSEGAFNVVEDICDAGLTIVGGIISGVDYLVDGDGKNAATEIIKEGVKSTPVSDFFEWTGCYDCYEQDFGSVTRDSFLASAEYVAGQVGAYVYGGSLMSKAGGAMGANLTGAKAGVQKVLTNSVLNQTLLAGVTGMGSGGEDYLQNHDDGTMFGALGAGTIQGAEQAGVAYIMGKGMEAAGRYDAKKAFLKASDKLDDAVAAETKAQTAFDEAAAEEAKLYEKLKTDSSAETMKSYENAKLARQKAKLNLDIAKSEKVLAEGKLNKLKPAEEMAKADQKLKENKNSIKDNKTDYNQSLKNEKIAQKNAIESKAEALEKGVNENELLKMEKMDATELKADATKIEGEINTKKASIESTEKRIAEIKSENAKIRAEGREPSPENIKELNKLENSLKETKTDITKLEGKKQFNDSLRYEKNMNTDFKTASNDQAALKNERAKLKNDLKTKTNEYKQAQSKAETQRAIDKHQSKVEAKELKELKKEYKQMQKEGADAYNNAPKETQAELKDIDSKLSNDIKGKQSELKSVEGDIDAYKATNKMYDDAGVPRDAEITKKLNEANAKKASLENDIKDLTTQKEANTKKFIERQSFDEGVKARTDKLAEIENKKIDTSWKNVEQGAYKTDLEYKDLEYKSYDSFEKPTGIKDTETHLNNLKTFAGNEVKAASNLGKAVTATAKVTAPYGPHALINSGVRDVEIENRHAIAGIEYENGRPVVSGSSTSPTGGKNGIVPPTGNNQPKGQESGAGSQGPTGGNQQGGGYTGPTGGGYTGPTGGGNSAQHREDSSSYVTTSPNGGNSSTNQGRDNSSQNQNSGNNSQNQNNGNNSQNQNNGNNSQNQNSGNGSQNQNNGNNSQNQNAGNNNQNQGGGEIYNPYTPNNENTTVHTGGGYTRTGGYSSSNDNIYTAPGGTNTITSAATKGKASIDDIVKGSKYTKIPTNTTPIKTNGSSGLGNVIPIAAGLSAAAAAGIGAKAYLDHKKNNDNDDSDNDEFEVEDDNFGAEEWTGDENTMEIDYDDSSDKVEEQYLDDDDEFGYQSEPEEKYGARTSEELADLQ